jgi:hypothetical protein
MLKYGKAKCFVKILVSERISSMAQPQDKQPQPLPDGAFDFFETQTTIEDFLGGHEYVQHPGSESSFTPPELPAEAASEEPVDPIAIDSEARLSGDAVTEAIPSDSDTATPYSRKGRGLKIGAGLLAAGVALAFGATRLNDSDSTPDEPPIETVAREGGEAEETLEDTPAEPSTEEMIEDSVAEIEDHTFDETDVAAEETDPRYIGIPMDGSTVEEVVEQYAHNMNCRNGTSENLNLECINYLTGNAYGNQGQLTLGLIKISREFFEHKTFVDPSWEVQLGVEVLDSTWELGETFGGLNPLRFTVLVQRTQRVTGEGTDELIEDVARLTFRKSIQTTTTEEVALEDSVAQTPIWLLEDQNILDPGTEQTTLN